jgi:hypothetical protein
VRAIRDLPSRVGAASDLLTAACDYPATKKREIRPLLGSMMAAWGHSGAGAAAYLSNMHCAVWRLAWQLARVTALHAGRHPAAEPYGGRLEQGCSVACSAPAQHETTQHR